VGLLTTPSRHPWLHRRSGALVAVVAVHGLIVALALHARGRVAAAQEPLLIMHVAMLQETPPPAPPAPLAPPTVEIPRTVQLVMPQVVIPTIELPDSSAVVARTVSAPAVVVAPPAAPAAAPPGEPVRLEASEVDYLRMPQPHYPRAARLAHLQGTVLVWVLIDTDGNPQQVRVQKSSGFEVLDREGCEAVRHALFKPYRRQGIPLAAQAIVPVEFSPAIRLADRE